MQPMRLLPSVTKTPWFRFGNLATKTSKFSPISYSSLGHTFQDVCLYSATLDISAIVFGLKISFLKIASAAVKVSKS